MNESSCILDISKKAACLFYDNNSAAPVDWTCPSAVRDNAWFDDKKQFENGKND